MWIVDFLSGAFWSAVIVVVTLLIVVASGTRRG